MQHLEVSGAVRPLKWPLGVKWLRKSIKRFVLNLCITEIFLEPSASPSRLIEEEE